MVLPRFHPFPVGPQPPSATPSLFSFILTPSRLCGRLIPARGSPPRAKACIPPFVCFGIYRASRFSSTSKKRDRIRFRRNRSRFSTTVIDERSVRVNLVARTAPGDVLIGIHRNDILAENIVTSAPGSAATLKAESVGNALRCTLETNRGEELEYVPEHHQIRGDIECIDNKTCSFRINKANVTHAGVWKVTAYTVRQENKENEKSDVDLRDDDATPEVFLFKLYIHQVNLTPHCRPIQSDFVFAWM